MNYWQGNKICLRAMEESDADFFYETLQDMDIQKNESNNTQTQHKFFIIWSNDDTLMQCIYQKSHPFFIYKKRGK